MKRLLLVWLCLCCLHVVLHGQQTGRVTGQVLDSLERPLEGVHIVVSATKRGTITDSAGRFSLLIPADRSVVITFSFLGYEAVDHPLTIEAGKEYELTVMLSRSGIELDEIAIRDERVRSEVSAQKIDPKNIERLPNPGSSLEGVLRTLPGVAAGNEMSSQYSVRGGNFDENLVYVNDFEIYRPMLTRLGMMEGMSFINTGLVSSIFFSSGGFNARYGDRMSSVLDIQYREPKSFEGSVAGSFLGGDAHIGGSAADGRFTYLIGTRYQTNQYMLNAMDVQGDYQHAFGDIQTYMTYQLSDKLKLGWLNYYSQNQFGLTPETRETKFGTVRDVLNFRVHFQGEEQYRFRTAMSGLSLTYKHSNRLKLKWLASGLTNREVEAEDVIGQYWLHAVETDFGSEDFGQELFSLGAGTHHQWRRNQLDFWVLNTEHKGYYTADAHYLQWGLKYQHEIIDDRLNEWLRIDSAGYALPFSSEEVRMNEVVKGATAFSSHRISGYLQDTWYIGGLRDITLTGGARFSYWSLNDAFIISPRVQFAYKPRWKRDIMLKAASGIYYQPPFYRELRTRRGELNTGVRAQRSIHFVAGADWNFIMWDRPFKFVTELYYKKLDNLNPYIVNNVFIDYFAENSGRGYAAGMDFRLHGEFIEDAESWVSLSLMRTEERLPDNFYVREAGEAIQPGFIPRPTDQLVNFGLFFQDHIPGNKNFKAHVQGLFATGLPFGPPNHTKHADTLRMRPYRRVDIGFSAQLLSKAKELPAKNPLRHLRSVWVTAEVFNMLGVNNTISYIWVRDLGNRMYGIPDFLTTRRFNVRLIVKF